jgi:aminopeptidase N
LTAQKTDVYQRPVQTEPDRDFDALHYCIKLDIDLNGKKITGQNTITLVPLRTNLERVTLDAVSLVVRDVFDVKGTPLTFDQKDEKLQIYLRRPFSYTDTVKFTVNYSLSEQVKGLRFIDKTKYSPLQVSSDCFPDKARQWIPCYDYPHDKVTQEMIVTVDKQYKVLSNGSLLSVAEDNNRGKRTWHWKQNRPHSTYLINLSIADYAVIKDSLGSLPINYWVYQWNVDDARRSFAKTPYMIDFFNKLYNYKFPWEKYDQVISAYMGGGAEATSATLLGEGAVTDRKAEIDYSYEGIIAHEIAHQWWGDLITCRSWEHTWMNESFGTYSDYLYKCYSWGKDESDYDLFKKKNSYLNEAHNRYMRPIVFNRYENPGQNFDSHSYPKGASVLHMLRFIVGDDTFFRILSTFLHKFEFRAVTTQDFMKCVKEVSGMNMDWFSDQFLFHPGHASFVITKNWDEASKILTLKIVQNQDKWENVPIYTIPVNIGIYTSGGKTIKKVWLNKKTESFEFRLDSEPLMVRFDEGNYLLKEWTFKLPEEELLYQVKNDDVPGRLWAIDELKTFSNSQKTTDTWSDLAVNDKFWAVREAAIRNLSEFHILKKELFHTACGDKSSKVRVAAIKALGESGDKSLVGQFTKIFETDDSYLVMAEALLAIGKIGTKSSLGFLKEAEKVESPRDVVKNAAEKAVGMILQSSH